MTGKRASFVGRALAIFVVAMISSVALGLGSAGCDAGECNGGIVDLKDPVTNVPTVGHMVDDDTWESNAINEPWLDFPAKRVYVLHAPQLVGRKLVSTEAYDAVDPLPNDTNWTTGSGNIAEFGKATFTPAGPDGTGYSDFILVANDTCAHFYVRVVLRVAHVNAPPAVADAGDAGDASEAGNVVDAGADVSNTDAADAQGADALVE